MKSTIKALLTVLLFFMSQSSMAQWRFHAEVFPSDECENTLEGKISRSAAKGMCNDDNSKTWRTEQECNEVRKVLLEWNQEAPCRIVVKVSPCQCSGNTDRVNGNTDRVNGNHSRTSRSNNSQQAMLAKKRAAKESARRKAEAERIRKERERQRKYNEALQKGYQQTSAAYSTMHKETAYRSGEGFERMMLTVPVGTERIQSGYIPSETVVNPADIDEIIARRTYSQFEAIRLLPDNYRASNTGGLVYVNWGDYGEMQRKLDDCMRDAERSRQIPCPYRNEYERVESTMDGCQIAMMEFVMRENNNGILPKFVGIDDDGGSVFESEDGKRLFIISANGRHLQVLTSEEKNYWDNIIIRDIQDKGYLKYLDEAVQIKYKGGTIELKDLNKLDKDMLKELLPQIKAELKLNLIDNTNTYQYKYYYLTPEVVNTSAIVGISGKLSGGGRSSVNAGFNATKVVIGNTGDDPPPFFNAKLEISHVDAELAGTGGFVVRIGNRYYLASGEVGLSGGIGAKAEAKLDIKQRKGKGKLKVLLGAEIGGALLQDITPPPSIYHSDGFPVNNNTGK